MENLSIYAKKEKMKTKKHLFIATVFLYEKGKKKSYGATTRQYSAINRKAAKRVFIKNFKFKNNVVKVNNLRQYKRKK